MSTLIIELIVLIVGISFAEKKILPFAVSPEQRKDNSSIVSDLDIEYPFFQLIYTGNGVDHMNINLVNLASTGLILDDEIGVFDGKYCVGLTVIKEKQITSNSISIAASANENLETKPNGYIDGHEITLKTYRSGKVYLLFFETVNNSKAIFEKGGSMFALVDFSRSTVEDTLEGMDESFKIYPNPFESNLRIKINIPKTELLNCEIVDITGNLIITLFNGIIEGQHMLIWDGKDNRNHQVPSGIYFCRINQMTAKIIYLK